MKYVDYAGICAAGFCFICGFRLDVGCDLVVESTRCFGGICDGVAFLACEKESHVILDVRSMGDSAIFLTEV